jgi:oxygen-independent coproporphyrinogen-3 oxidase
MYCQRFKSHHDCYRDLKNALEQNLNKEDYVSDLLQKSDTASEKAIYIHIPYCNKICSFCSFIKKSLNNKKEYHNKLIEEINRIKDYPYMQSPISSIYFGGGTPTSLEPYQMEMVLKKLHSSFNIVEGAEISIETACTELTDEMLKTLKNNGVNRLSIGVQTFNNEQRKLLGRRGSGEHAFESVQRAREYIENTGIDLIYNIPGQSISDLKDDLDKIVQLKLSGISFYSLMIYDDTPIKKLLSQDDINKMNDIKKEYQQFECILDNLIPQGYQVFELTKLIRNNLDKYDYIRIRHNGGCCIPLGHGSGGNLENYHFYNSYQGNVISSQAKISNRGRVVSPTYKYIDMFIFDLQQAQVDLTKYSTLLKMDLGKIFKDQLILMERNGLIIYDNSKIRLTRSGIFWGNNIINEFVRTILHAI